MQRYEEKFGELFGEAGFAMEVEEEWLDGAWLSFDDMAADMTERFFIQDSQFPAFLQALRIAYNAGIGDGKDYGYEALPAGGTE